ncbi:MAG: hypothetical protein ABJR23_22265, partial [Paracoccaceae bacterium]
MDLETPTTPSARAQTSLEVQQDLNRAIDAVVVSGVLGKSERRAQLLRYLVEKEHAGRGKELKAYSIALDVFARGSDFDPNTDSIVRTEVGRLRDALTLYYAGNVDPELPRIDIPKGTYRPTISLSETPTVPPMKSPRLIAALR